ncbi:M15 family metallopeptidase [uncultured Eudoraea sp.]|uniref:M15 family metallopeptidase n=1 Tax=uncultured Eudoraea sp. TaxID=1035614 RepID=UPI00260F344A|nr:M15 family metallopeptidase [uncultured Eudoraea sp.]
MPKSLLKTITFFCFIILFTACKEKSVKEKVLDTESDSVIVLDAQTQSRIAPREDALKSLVDIADTTFVRLADYSSDFEYDLRYATENNFLKAKVYNCAECYTRVKTAKALIKANNDFIKQGYKIKFYDCYRPNSVQYKMWEIVPNPQYVANPVKGSIHNKGGAVDITLETLSGDELDMGTDFDFFGKKAYHDNTDLPKEILKNRKVLKETMEKYGFWSVRTEWWHYNLSSASNDRIADFKWECN